VPRKYRRNPNAFDYIQTVPAETLRKANSRVQADLENDGNDETMICVICMNPVHLDVDEHGGVIKRSALAGGVAALSASWNVRQSGFGSWMSLFRRRDR